MPSADFSPEDALALTGPTDDYLCSLSANTYGIEFISFLIQDYYTRRTFFEVDREKSLEQAKAAAAAAGVPLRNMLSTERKIHYKFGTEVLLCGSVATTLTFKVGPRAVPTFRMIERHYFKGKLIKSFDFDFGFCIPKSTNSWEAVYLVPGLSKELVDDIVACPREMTSDSFYFVDDKLVMHNKADYTYHHADPSMLKGPGFEQKFDEKQSDRDEGKSAGRSQKK